MARKILIAEDELHIRLLIEQSIEELEDEGVEILTASDGEEALMAIRAERPDLVLLDVMMPKMNGFEVCEQIRQEPELVATKVVMLTAKGQEYDRKRGKEAGVDQYLTKPFNPDQLLAIARRAIGLDQ
jgi:DNA-binding response OmpR family regulator